MMALNFSAIIGAVLFGMAQQDLIIFVIVVQITNVVGAYIFGRWVDSAGGKQALIGALLMMIGVVAAMYFAQTTRPFLSHWRSGGSGHGWFTVGEPYHGGAV